MGADFSLYFGTLAQLTLALAQLTLALAQLTLALAQSSALMYASNNANANHLHLGWRL